MEILFSENEWADNSFMNVISATETSAGVAYCGLPMSLLTGLVKLMTKAECVTTSVSCCQGPAGEIGPPGQQGNPGVQVPYQHKKTSLIHLLHILWVYSSHKDQLQMYTITCQHLHKHISSLSFLVALKLFRNPVACHQNVFRIQGCCLSRYKVSTKQQQNVILKWHQRWSYKEDLIIFSIFQHVNNPSNHPSSHKDIHTYCSWLFHTHIIGPQTQAKPQLPAFSQLCDT